MKIFSTLGLLLFGVAVFGQLPDSVDMRISYFGIPSQAPDPDFVKTQTARINARDVYINDRADSLKDGTGALVLLSADVGTIANVTFNGTNIYGDSIAVGGFYLTDTYWDDLRVPLTNTKITPAASEPVFEDMGSGVFAYGFDADADSTEYLHFIAQLPHNYKVGTDLEAHIHWSPATTNTGNILWKMKYRMAAVNDTIVALDSLRILDAADGIALKHQLSDFGTIAGDSLGISSIIIGNVSRVGEDATDTFTGNAFGLEIDFHYQVDGFGSPVESTKDY